MVGSKIVDGGFIAAPAVALSNELRARLKAFAI
jgi:hypothetical protein